MRRETEKDDIQTNVSPNKTFDHRIHTEITVSENKINTRRTGQADIRTGN